MTTITTRLTLWYVIIFGLILIPLAGVMYQSFASDERATLDGELENYAAFLVSEAGEGATSADQLFDALQEITERANLRFHSMRFMLATTDSVIYEDLPGVAPFDLLADSLHSSAGLKTVETEEHSFRIYRMQIPRSNLSGLAIIVIAPLDQLESSLERLRDLLLVTVPAALLIASVGGWFIARRALTPVAEIRRTASMISSGTLEQRVPVGESHDELHDLALTFNRMIDRLEGAFASQRRFVADASHDLRTPLMVIDNELERLERSERLGASERSAVAECRGEVELLTHLTSDLLLLARADAHQLTISKETLRLDEILYDAIERIRHSVLEKRIALQIDIDDEVEVVGDRLKLERALGNLLDNAVVYSENGGHVVIHCAVVGGRGVLSVLNHGAPIPPEDLPRIFDRFYRADRSRNRHGTGLGLAIVRAIIEAHGGEITIRSSEEKGTEAIVSLPGSAA